MTTEQEDYLKKYYFHLLPFEAKAKMKYPYLSIEESIAYEAELLKMLIEKYADKVFWNLCPKCSKLARTPSAKQCRFCYHDWH